MNIKKIKKFNLKILLSHTIGAVVLLTFASLTIMYSKGRFEIPFFDRNQNDNVIIEFETNLRESDNTGGTEEYVTEEITNIAVIINPSDLIVPAEISSTENSYAGENITDAENTGTTEPPVFVAVYSEYMEKMGFSVSDGIYELYDEEKINAEKNFYRSMVDKLLREGTDSQYIPPEPLLYEYRFVKAEPEYKIPKSPKISTENGLKTTVETYMDYIIIRSGELEILCTASGKVITPDFRSSGYEILKMRDEYNRTVFKKDDLYYVYDSYEGDFIQIVFSEILGDRGVPFMYPSYYGADGANNLYRYYNPVNRKWGYMVSGTKNAKIWAIYGKVFNFNENIGIAYQDSSGRGNKLYFLDERGYNILNGDYFAPDEATSEHLGFFYIDHGLTRAYLRERKGFDIVEKEVMLELSTDANGYTRVKEFYLPEDYTVKAYSNGMILLEKDGYYGFMNYLGEWVAQPIYTYAQPFYEGVAVIGLENGKKALIDTKGNLVLKFKYDIITDCTGGIIALYEDGQGWTILNKVRKKIAVD